MSAIATPTAKRLVTAEEFSRMPNPSDGSKQELLRGEVVTMPPPGAKHGIIQNRIGFLLTLHTSQHDLGQVAVESGVVTETGPDTVRGPDILYWSFERFPEEHTPSGYWDDAADLCVEVRSPSNSAADLSRKTREYLAAGVRLVWIVDPKARTVTTYRGSGEGRVLREDANIDGEDVLPGFTCRVSTFFNGPLSLIVG